MQKTVNGASPSLLAIACLFLALSGQPLLASEEDGEFRSRIRTLLAKYCTSCHGRGQEVHGDVNLAELSPTRPADFDTWQTAASVIRDGLMPPEDQPQPSDSEKQAVIEWVEQVLAPSLRARPGPFRPRRLSVIEYRNTLETLLGFPLKTTIREAEQTVSETSLVFKLLPTDPPGPSGFTNDTSRNPLTTNAWDQYSYLVDVGLERLFSAERTSELEKYTGKLHGQELSVENAEQALRRFTRRAWRRVVNSDPLMNLALKRMRECEPERLRLGVAT